MTRYNDASQIHGVNKDLTSLLEQHFKEEVFYLPSFGPVFTHGNDVHGLIQDLLGYWDYKTFLPYDKNRRWFQEKEECIYVPEVSVMGADLYIPVLNTFREPVLKIFIYSDVISDKQISAAQEIASCIIGKERISKILLVTNRQPASTKVKHSSNLYLKRICDLDEYDTPAEIRLYAELPDQVKRTFSNLATEDNLPGSHMLWQKFLGKGEYKFPILVAIEEDQIIGMIGPLDIIEDHWGKHQLLPPFFEVSLEARRKGYGKKLWETAMNWADKNNAEYMLIQAETGEAADYFYQTQGLELKGTQYSTQLKI